MTTIAPRQTRPSAWRAADMSDPERWTWRLDGPEIEELLNAVSRLGDPSPEGLRSLERKDFPLPILGPRLVALRRELIAGRGFQVVSGLPVAAMTEDEASTAFVGIGTHLGSTRSQNAAGDLLGHVRNVGLDASNPSVRIYQTDERQTFHTDSTDAVGLLCLETAAQGGESLLVSAAAIYNEMLDRDPTAAALLFDEVATDRRGEVPPGQEAFFRIPVLSWFDEHLTVIYQRQYIDSADRFAEAPRRSPEMIEALDLFDEIANDPSMHIRMHLAPGDMQFVHNHSLLHDRTGFVDKPGSPRHLLRLWLSLPGDRELPPIFASRYGSTVVGDRGGIVV
ncbi:MAG: TauD/TfdA family dioxygenase [Actinomycetota bacterium]